jgi:hypothetical protein
VVTVLINQCLWTNTSTIPELHFVLSTMHQSIADCSTYFPRSPRLLYGVPYSTGVCAPHRSRQFPRRNVFFTLVKVAPETAKMYQSCILWNSATPHILVQYMWPCRQIWPCAWQPHHYLCSSENGSPKNRQHIEISDMPVWITPRGRQLPVGSCARLLPAYPWILFDFRYVTCAITQVR